MEKEQRSRLQKATQDARRLLEEEFSRQLLETYDINVAAGRWSEEPGAHLQAEQRLLREKLLAWIEHRSVQINDEKEALLLALREMAFTALNRFVALKLMEARELVRACVSGGLESEGFQEFTAVAQGLLVEQESSYRLYLETIFEDVSRELRALFDPRDPASLLWPKRTALLELLDILNRPELAELWREDETLGWIYQYFNGDSERKKMREESSAPRNSRELAVRNQFFTPRYVVEFLTDNTLGRIWYEMRQGDTGLKERCRYLVRRPNEIWLQSGEEPPAEVVADEALSQEELLRQPVHIPYRPLKDPREIRMLDPACGSMHFGLYAFDLYLEIYAEAWEIAKGSSEQTQQGEAFAPFVAYAADFGDKAAFLREVPRLILQHNIHGIDIDPRATQIARLTLWLRAQRAWQEQQLEVAARPAITRSNVVCAEPMPGERELLADFVDEQFPEAERGLVQQLLEAIFDKMQLAGEAGSLLKIEEEIRDAIDHAQREWKKLAVQQQNLFGPNELATLGQLGSSLNVDLVNLTRDFWLDIEERIYDALRGYAEQTQSGSGLQRRLFAEDAAQGFAFIDVCRKRYDAALMNPPFGDWSKKFKAQSKIDYSDCQGDILSAFIERGSQLLEPSGTQGAITSRTCLFLTSFAKWRTRVLLGELQPVLIADLGHGVMDAAMVEAAAYVLNKIRSESSKKYQLTAMRLLEAKDSERALLQSARNSCNGLAEPTTYYIAPSAFRAIPHTPFAYWVTDRIRRIFVDYPAFEGDGRTARQGLATADDFRFVRTGWEVSTTDVLKSWFPYVKGGSYSPFYADVNLLVNWRGDGAEIRCFGDPLGIRPSSRPQNTEYYFRPGLTWPRRTRRFCPRILPAGVIFSDGGQAVFCPGEELATAVILFSSLSQLLISLSLGTSSMSSGGSPQFMAGTVSRFPFNLTKEFADHAKRLATRQWSMRQSLDAREITSLAFYAPSLAPETTKAIVPRINALDGSTSTSLACCIEKLQNLYAEAGDELERIEREIDELVYDLYQISDCDRSEIAAMLPSEGEDSYDAEADHNDDSDGKLFGDAHKLGSTLLDYLLGCSFGRWDIHYATGARNPPVLSDPFAKLPVCPPGQLQNAQGLPARPEDVPAAYPVRIPWDGILVDDPNHPLDFEHRIREVIEIIWSGQEGGPTSDAIEHEACDILGVKTLRDYFRKPAGFFAEHLKRYSKSRRQAPIYWQLSAGNGIYSAWLYYHRFTQDTLYRVLRDFVEPRIQDAEREQFEFESQGGLSGDAAVLLHEVQALLQDLQLFKSELELVAPLWNPNLNDGVIINHAILWRITPYTPWQKKCKECWDKLVKGDYDWAHLAFHLWPERVIRKCVTDRSLAIAHGLEERLWQETSKGNWLQRQVSEVELQALLAEYSKPAVQNALERFLAASPPVAAARTRAPRAGKSSSISTTRRARGSAPEVDAETSRQTLLVLTAAPADGLGRNAIAELLAVEAASLTAVIKQLKEVGQIEQLGAARGAKYRLSESGLAAVESQAGEG